MSTAQDCNLEQNLMCLEANEANTELSDGSEDTPEADSIKSNGVIGPTHRMKYRPSDNPPLHLALVFALQNILMALPWCLTETILVSDFVCAENDYTTKAVLFSSTLMMSGLTSLAQVTIGVRLPIFQGPSTSYITPLLVLKELPDWSCPAFDEDKYNMTKDDNVYHNMTYNYTLTEYRTSVIYPRLQLTMGSLMLTGFIHMSTGMFGFIGCLMRFVGPVTVIPTVLLIGLGTFHVTTNFCMIHWGVAAITCTTSLVLSLYLDGWKMPLLTWNRETKWHIIRYPLHQVLSVDLISIIVGWVVSAILTATDTIPNDPDSPAYMARTDVRSDVIRTTPWFYLPYPGQFGSMSFSGGVFVTFILATMYSIIDSIADYYTCARTARVPPPPLHALNRGIMIEGLLGMVSGVFGVGHATTTFGINIGTMGVTKVASRLVYILCPCLLVLFSIIGKLAAVLITIPDPVLGGVQIIGFGMFIGLVMSNFQYIDLNSTRNLAIIGLSILLGLMLPYWVTENSKLVNTGHDWLENLIRVILANPSLVGGFTACFLDNTVPGTLHERGLLTWGPSSDSEEVLSIEYDEGYEIYEIKSWTAKTNKLKFTKYIPFFPNYEASGDLLKLCKTDKCHSQNKH